MEKTREMFKLGQVVFLEGIDKLIKCRQMNFIHDRHEMIIKKRLAVVEFTHGLELILKAILIKRGYSICKVKNGIYKDSEKLCNITNFDRTIELEEVIRFFKKVHLTLPFDSVDKLRLLRNQIIHRGTDIDEKKKEYFIGAIDCLIGVYNLDNIKHKKFLEEIKQAKEKI